MTSTIALAAWWGLPSVEVHDIDQRGKILLRKRLTRGKVLAFLANLPPCLISLETCGGAHYWRRELAKVPARVRLMPPQYVKAYVKTNKHDAADAEARCEVVQRPSMRFAPTKREAEEATVMLHRVRDLLIAQRTAAINALRGHLAERGIVAAKLQTGLCELIAAVGDVDHRRIPPLAREVLQTRVAQISERKRKMADLDRRLIVMTGTNETCRSLVDMPGVGPIIATGLVATVPDAGTFRSARHLAAWLGLVPRQHSSGARSVVSA